MGHIDHGKTTLLDKIRSSNVAEKESGGITQHIGAYAIEVKNKEGQDKKITFLDTPGHEAFSKMRSRGAKVADIALLIVAADDGVKPQTEEALKAIQEANLPFIVVVNKIDKNTADLEKAKKELGDRGIIFEEWGGGIPLAKVSAKTGEGIPELLDLILLMSDLGDLTYDSSKKAQGVVIESHLDAKRGQAATLLLRDGTLKKGDWVLAQDARVKIRILEDEFGKSRDEVSASAPIRVIGFDKAVKVGSTFNTFETREELDAAFQNEASVEPQKFVITEGQKTIPLVLKADVAGSLEAVLNQLSKIGVPDAQLIVLRSDVGNITEDDVKAASASKNSLVIGFRVKIDKGASAVAERFGVKIKSFDLIYELEEWLRQELLEIIGEEQVRKVLGIARVIKIFKDDGSKKIVGGVVESGGIFLGKKFTLLRRNFPLGDGKISELQSGKIKVKEILEGEFGALVEINLES
jgi:translation initiation factor IF-2